MGVLPKVGKQRVREYWEEKPCGSIHGEALEGSPEYYANISRRRDQLEPFISDFADFEGARGRSLLEIGVGMGSDLVRFARAGARASGVDLTEKAIEHTRRRLELEGLTADLQVSDAENLPFEDASFDRVYSWGVLHHTPDTQRAIGEAIRVLRPGGDLTLMLYARRSWVAYGLWVRHALIVGRLRRSLSDVLAGHMESEGTKAYTFPELRLYCAGLEDLRLRRIATPYDRRVAGPLVDLLGDRLGWFVVVSGRTPLGT